MTANKRLTQFNEYFYKNFNLRIIFENLKIRNFFMNEPFFIKYLKVVIICVILLSFVISCDLLYIVIN
jgi:hypothetical protein